MYQSTSFQTRKLNIWNGVIYLFQTNYTMSVLQFALDNDKLRRVIKTNSLSGDHTVQHCLGPLFRDKSQWRILNALAWQNGSMSGASPSSTGVYCLSHRDGVPIGHPPLSRVNHYNYFLLNDRFSNLFFLRRYLWKILCKN